MTGKRRKRHGPEQIVRKLRDADAMLNVAKDLAAVFQALEVSEVTCRRWRNQYGGMKAQEADGARGQEQAAQGKSGRNDARQSDAEVCGGKKPVSPSNFIASGTEKESKSACTSGVLYQHKLHHYRIS